MKYKIEYLPSALEELKEDIKYINDELKNPSAAEKLGIEIINEIETLSDFPYSAPHYNSIRPLLHEYRRLLIRNHFVFYWVDEKSHTITISRIINARRNINNLLK